MNRVHVAVGVILDRQQNILLTKRAADAHQGGRGGEFHAAGQLGVADAGVGLQFLQDLAV